jgi:hypothetical protein
VLPAYADASWKVIITDRMPDGAVKGYFRDVALKEVLRDKPN